MDLREYLRVLRAHRLLIVASMVICTALAAALAWTRTPQYAAHTQLFVATRTSTNPGDIYAAGLFSEQRIGSYAQLVSNATVLRSVVKDLHLPFNAGTLATRIHATVPPGTVLIDVTVTDTSPQRAAAIATALGTRFSQFVSQLETTRKDATSPINVRVTSPPTIPVSPYSPRKKLYVVLGALLGFMLGIVGAVLREAYSGSRATAPNSRVSPGRTQPGRASDREEGAVVMDAAATSAIVEAPVLGTVAASNGQALIVADRPSSTGADAYRHLQTNLRSVALDQGLKSLVVTSAIESEGKTVVAANLGIAFAQAGYRVVLVEANQRRPNLTDVLGLPLEVGLNQAVTEDVPVGMALHTWHGNPLLGGTLEVLTAGSGGDGSTDLGSGLLEPMLRRLGDRADFVIFDGPALLTRDYAGLPNGSASGTILVTRAGSTRVDQLMTAAESLRALDANVVGVVLNQSRITHWA
jgi:succinoglycan biosynthesis transport protein ExoP